MAHYKYIELFCAAQFFSAGFLNNPFDTYCLSHFYCHVDNGDGGNMLARSSEDRESFAERPAKRVRQACEPCRYVSSPRY